MDTYSLNRQILDKAAEIIRRRLSLDECRAVLKDIDRERRGVKSVERMVAEIENPGRLLRTKIDNTQLPHFLVELAGPDILTNKSLRFLLAFRASEGELDQLHDFPGAAKAHRIARKPIAECIANRNWYPGKKWARHFVSTLGLPPLLAGIAGIPDSPDFEDVEPHVPLPPLEDFQEDLRLQTVEVLTSAPGANRAILTLPTGAGKTRTTVEAVIDWWLGERETDFILWIAQSDELCEQAVQAFREVWIDRGDRHIRGTLRIYRFWGGRKTIPSEAGIIISTIDKLRKILVEAESLHRQEEFFQIVSGLGIIIIDEAHRAEAPSYRRVLEALGIEFTQTAKTTIPILGLTATPLRSQHEETLRLSKRFYNRLLRPRNLPEAPAAALAALRDRGILSHPAHKVLPANSESIRLTKKQEDYLNEWKDLHPEVLAQLGQERNCNRQILETMMALDPSWPVLFFGCSVQHAEAIAVLLRRRGREAAAITASTREATRRHLVQGFRKGGIKVLCNYGVLTTGFDAPRVRAVVIGRPTTSRVLYEQMIGRGMRGPQFGGTDECLVIDMYYNLVHHDGRKISTAAQQYQEYWSSQS